MAKKSTGSCWEGNCIHSRKFEKERKKEMAKKKVVKENPPSGHTPTPWKLMRGADGGADAFLITGPGQCYIAHVSEADGGQTNEEDAAFIVHAVNAHDDLVAAINGLLNTPAMNTDYMDEVEIMARNKAYAVLKKWGLNK